MAPITNGAMYGQLFADSPDHCLFVRTLASGQSCQTQLVYNSTSGKVCVRKALLYARSSAPWSAPAAEEFDRDVRTVSRLLALAAKGPPQPRIPALLAASAPDTAGQRFSYWDLCNGGTLFAFLARCEAAGAPLPLGMALHILQQSLETLEFMHSAPEYPVFHRDLHQRNLVLHFAPGRQVPDVFVIDFGSAATCDPEDEDDFCFACADGDLPVWDVREILNLVRNSLVERLSPADMPSFSSASPSAAAGKEQKTGAPAATHPLDHAVHLLEKLHREFRDGNLQTVLRPPSLAKVIRFLRRVGKPLMTELRFADKHALFRDAVLAPLCKRARRVSAQPPAVCRSVEGLVQWLEEGAAGVEAKGPWDVAEVGEGWDVRRVLMRQEREGRRLEKWERMEDEGEESPDEDEGERLEAW